MDTDATENQHDSQSIRSRWGDTIAAGGYGSGWTPVPTPLIRNIGKLRLRATDFAVLVAILAYWWRSDRMPTVRTAGVARHLGLSPRTIERSLRKLRQAGLLRVERRTGAGGQTENVYDLRPLVERVDELALQDLALISEARAKRTAAEEFDDDVPF